MNREELLRELEEIEKQEYVLLKQIEAYEARNRIKFFIPHKKQQFAFNAVNNPRKFTIVFQGSNRSGKTTWLILSVISLILGEFPWSGEKTRFKPPIRARLMGEDWLHHIGQVLVPKLYEWIPPQAIERTKRNNQGVEYLWTFRNGSVLELMTYEQSTEQMEGWSGHVVAADEPMPRDKYIACKRGLVDHNGIFLMSFTPLKEPWIYDEIVNKADPSIAVFGVDINDNPYLTKEAKEEFERSLTEEEKEARLRGKWLHLQGLVYKEFEHRIHVVPEFVVPPDYTGYCGIDTHPRTEQAIIFGAVDERDRIFFTHEVFTHCSPDEIADFVIYHHLKRYPLHTVVIDPSSQGDKNRGDSTFEVIQNRLWKYKIGLELGSKDLEGGILAVKNFLRSRNGTPSLFICETLNRTLYEFGHYVWDEWRNKHEKTEKQKPRDKDDHMLECIRRICLLPPRYMKAYYGKPLGRPAVGVL